MPAALHRAASVLVTADVVRALAHYARLGFAVRAYEGGGYGYATRDGVDLHLAEVAHLDPATTTSCVYLYVDDAAALHAEWAAAGVEGRFLPPQATDYGLLEGAHVDADGNLLRYGSPAGG